MTYSEDMNHSDGAQSLILVLLVLMIGPVIAFAVVARTIQDIRRTGLERMSDKAGTQVETILDAITDDSIWGDLVQNGVFVGYCTGMNVCILDNAYLATNVGDLACDDAEVRIKLLEGVVDYPLLKDDVYEFRLDGTPGDFDVSWTSISGGQPTFLDIKVYKSDVTTSDPFDGVFALRNCTNSAPIVCPDAQWGAYVVPGVPQLISYGASAGFVRIRAIGGDVNLNVTGIPAQEMAVRSSCYIGTVSREFVRRVPLYASVPACFDYVLFDGSSRIDEFDGV